MRVLGLDLSSKTGFAVLDTDVQSKPSSLLKYGLIVAPPDKEYPIEEYRYLDVAIRISIAIGDIITEYKPNLIYIEQSNKGKNRHSQKFIEFIHCEVLTVIQSLGLDTKITYIDTSFWRTALSQRMTKEQRLHNKAVKKGEIRGKITPKHLSVKWVNENYKTEFKLKDNDIADAICVATAGVILLNQIGKNIVDSEMIEKALF